MTGLKIFTAFAVGAAVGVLATRQFFKTRYERFAQEEIDSVIEYSRPKKDETNDSAIEEPEEAMSVSDYAKELSQRGYTQYSNSEKPVEPKDEEPEEQEPEESNGPRLISPMEFGEYDDYDTITLYYHADHILTCDDEIVEDVDGVVGIESLTHFGDYEEDSVHVRNDRLKTDYEILLDHRKYTDIVKSKPYLLEDR